MTRRRRDTDSTINDRLNVQRLLLGVARRAVLRWEEGNRAPRPRALLRLVVVLEQLRAQDGAR